MEDKMKKSKIISPDELLHKILNWFDSRKKLAFLLSMFIGIITHITMITEMIMSQDGLWNSIERYRPGVWEATLGRWGIALIERITYFIAIPSVVTVFSIFLMAISAVFLVDLFDFKNKISIIVTSILVVVVPTLTSTLLYIYTATAYCANFLISVLVIWFLYKFNNKKLGCIIATICFMFSMSIYQSYIGVSIGLCIIMTILDLIKSEKNMKEIFIDIAKTVCVVICGAILYYIITMVILKLLNMPVASYKGSDTISIMQIILNLPTTIIQCYKDFFSFYISDKILYNSNFKRQYFNGAFLLVSAIIFVISLVKIKENNKKLKVILSLVCMILIPVGLNIIVVLIPGTAMYSLTSIQMILIIPFIFKVFEIVEGYELVKWCIVALSIMILGTYYLTDNASYAALKLTYNQVYSTTVRIMDRVENTEGYVWQMPMLFGGIVGDYNFKRESSLYEFISESLVRNPPFHATYDGSVGTWHKFIEIFLGLNVTSCSREDYYRIIQSDEYRSMNIFPYPNSTKVIDGIMVVKLIDTPELINN